MLLILTMYMNIISFFLVLQSVLQAYVDVVNDHKVQIEHANHAWLCLDLLEVLCQLAERDHASSVRSILEHPLKYCPEVLLLGMAHINVLGFDMD